MQQMSALDAGFLQLEDDHVALHIGATAVFEGPAPSDAEIHERYGRLMAAFPRYRQRLRRWPFDLRKPGWVDVAELDLNFHIRRSALPKPGSPEQLERLVGRVMSYRLDPERPLWEAWVVEGLEGDRWALVMKVHHSIVDGMGGMATFTELLDGAGKGARPARRPKPPRAATQNRAVRLARAMTSPATLTTALSRGIGVAEEYLRVLRPPGDNSLTGALGTARRYRALTVEMADVRRVREVFGGTLNDVVLTMVTGGFRSLLQTRGELEGQGVRSLVPVSLRAAEEARDGANRISFLVTDLPVDAEHPVEAHAEIRRRMTHLKHSGETAATGGGFALADLLPPPLVSAAVGAARHIPQRSITTVTTNVPGPPHATTMCGRPLLALYPYVPIAERIRIGVAVTSYADRLHFGITCDRGSVPDADVFVDAMARTLAELVKQAEAQ
jgi:diacylglycerol O-acyltransferase